MPELEAGLELISLADSPAVLPDCARWLYEEWGRQQVSAFEGTLDWLRGVAAASDEEGLVAVSAGAPVGIALLVVRDLESRRDLTPWLSSLFVVPEFRDRGIGRRLVEGVMAAAKGRGHAELYLHTESAEAYYRRLGWRLEDRFRRDGEAFALMSLAF